MTECGCGEPLDAHNLIGMCAECKHIERDRRRGYTAPEVTLDIARKVFMTVFGGHYRQQDTSAVYQRSGCKVCGKYAARWDSGRCEWHSRPYKPRPRKKPSSRKKVTGTETRSATVTVPPGDDNIHAGRPT